MMKEDRRVLYVGNIPWDASEEEVMADCAAVLGRVLSFQLVNRGFDADQEDVIIPVSPAQRKLKIRSGFGFLELEDEEMTEAAIRNHKRLPILCRNRRLRIAYPCRKHLMIPSSAFHSQEDEEICKHKIDHQSILLVTSWAGGEKKTTTPKKKSSCEQASPPILAEDRPTKEKKIGTRAAATIPMIAGCHEQSNSPISSDRVIDLQHSAKKQLTTAQIKKRPRSTTFEGPAASCCLECSPMMMPVQLYGAGEKYTSAVRCYYCNSVCKRQRIDDGAEYDHHIIEIHHPEKTRDNSLAVSSSAPIYSVARRGPESNLPHADSPHFSSCAPSVARHGEISTPGADTDALAAHGQLESDLFRLVHMLSCTHIHSY